MSALSFTQKIAQATAHSQSLLCIGLDPDVTKFPEAVLREEWPIFTFNRAIIDMTHDLVCAYKPQIAFYHAQRAEDQLEMTIQYLKEHYPHIPVILDAKRGDVGSTAQQYALEAFERYQADAVTVNPYLGLDALQPFLDYKEKGIIILCHTSNKGSKDVQELHVNDIFLYEKVAELAARQWNYNQNIGLVIGGTYPQALAKIRAVIGDMPLLVPGVGAQGAAIEPIVTHGKTPDGGGLIISASRSILYASHHHDFAKAARNAALLLRDEINQYR
ncbi:MAG TPA: orotidine-5'-phosphate decarboxylase [Gammaproteobacteria bacterium]|nr:orotidine-5'-phosphate decarboxylase [Gammaproteobacteria bacterium]